MNKLFWKMPEFIHNFIFWLTGYEMMEVINIVSDDCIKHPDGSIEYTNCHTESTRFKWTKNG